MPNKNTMDKKVVVILILILAAAGVYWYSTTTNTASNSAQQQAVVPAKTNTTSTANPSTPKEPLNVAVGATGEYLTDKNGLTLYVDVKDEGQKGKIKSVCDAACEKTWIPYIVDESDYGLISSSSPLFAQINIINRADGKQQFALGTKPLFTYVGDTKPGDIKGPVTGDWMVAAVVMNKKP